MTSNPYLFKKGQKPWNTNRGGCKRGHPSERYQPGPSGVKVCLDCKRINGAKYRAGNQLKINWKNRVQRYGLKVDDLDRMFNQQRGRCAICPTIFSDGNYRVDHDHSSGKVRGLLCAACNTAIGLLKDNPLVLQSAKDYLIDTSSPSTTAPPASIKFHIEYVTAPSYPGRT